MPIVGFEVDHMAKTRRERMQRNRKTAPCPNVGCGRPAKRAKVVTRELHDLERIIVLRYSQHYCATCKKYFSAPGADDFGEPNCKFTKRVVAKAIELCVECGETYREARWILLMDYDVSVHYTTVKKWCDAAGQHGG